MMTEQMKPSGIAWIGDIPEDWGITRLQKILFQVKERNWGTKEKNLLSLSYGNIITKDIEGSFGLMPESYDTYNIVHKGDIVLRLTDMQNDQVSLRTGFVKLEKGIITSAYVTLRSKTVDSAYYHWLLYVFDVSKEIYSFGQGVRQSLTYEELKKMLLPIPSLPEQKAIADYLDAQCAKIDSIAADLEKQIELLQKYKKSLITETVTKGLDKTAPMKDSGIEWIGEIPEKWEVKRLKYVLNNFDSQRKPIEAQNRSQEGDVLYDYYGASGAIDKIDDYIFDDTALLIGEDGANLVLRNLPLIYIATGKYWVNNHAHILRPKKESDLYYMAHQMEIIDYSLFITGSAQPKLSQENLNNVMLVVPPLTEQQEIAQYLEEKTASINNVIEDKQSQLDTIQQHKKSLIYEYVTGKRRVKEVQ